VDGIETRQEFVRWTRDLELAARRLGDQLRQGGASLPALDEVGSLLAQAAGVPELVVRQRLAEAADEAGALRSERRRRAR
jgi:hypothetical protein